MMLIFEKQTSEMFPSMNGRSSGRNVKKKDYVTLRAFPFIFYERKIFTLKKLVHSKIWFPVSDVNYYYNYFLFTLLFSAAR
jgi:hypothetical protein